jgi:hypothetical protein
MKWYKHIVFFLVMTVAAWSATDITDGCDLPENPLGGGYLHLTSDGAVLYKSPEAIGEFQFNIDGATVISSSGGYMTSNGLVGSAAINTFLAFSFTGGTGQEACTQDCNDDWGGAFNGDICLGARQWDTSGYNNGVCEITVN